MKHLKKWMLRLKTTSCVSLVLLKKNFMRSIHLFKGKHTTGLFQELDVIRRKQIDLASDHVSLEAIHDIP